MVLAELPRGIALILQRRRNGDDLVAHTNRGARNADFRQPGTVDALTSDEGGATGGARLLAVRVGEQHAFLGESVDVWRLIAHQAVRIAAQIRLTDVIAPDDEDVGFLAGLRICHVLYLQLTLRSRRWEL